MSTTTTPRIEKATIELVNCPNPYSLVREIKKQDESAFYIGGSREAAIELFKNDKHKYRDEDTCQNDFIAKVNEGMLRAYDAAFRAKGEARIIWHNIRRAGNQWIQECTVTDSGLPESNGMNFHGMSTNQCLTMFGIVLQDGKTSIHS